MTDNLLVTAHLLSPLAGDVPMLDAIVEAEMALKNGMWGKIRREDPAPPVGEIPSPIARGRIGGWEIPRASSPILSPEYENVEHFAKRLSVEHAGLLDPTSRLVVATGNTWTKSYRLPLRIRVVDRVCWFAVGRRKAVKSALKRVSAIGKKRSHGYGVVDRWEVEEAAGDYSWLAPGDGVLVLMRPLPMCDALPRNLVGCRRDFCGIVPPYWHPDRFAEVVVPC